LKGKLTECASNASNEELKSSYRKSLNASFASNRSPAKESQRSKLEHSIQPAEEPGLESFTRTLAKVKRVLENHNKEHNS